MLLKNMEKKKSMNIRIQDADEKKAIIQRLNNQTNLWENITGECFKEFLYSYFEFLLEKYPESKFRIALVKNK